MPSLLSSEAGSASSRSLVPQIQRTMEGSLPQRRYRSESLPWELAEPTQDVYTLSRTLGIRYLVVRLCKDFPEFRQDTQHLAAMAL